MIPIRSRFTRGGLAGAAAATVLAIWFFVIDAGRGEPFGTVAFVASALAGRDAIQASGFLILLFTVLHFGIFALLGAFTAWLLDILSAPASILFGFVLGFLLFDAVFYTGLTVSGVGIVKASGWPQVLAGNLLAGLVLMAVLRSLGPEDRPGLLRAAWKNRILREGFVAGTLGASSVALWFLLFDLFAGRPLFTPGALGSALFLGVADASLVQISPATVLGYSVLHVGGFLVAGTVSAALVARAEESPPLILVGLLLFVSSVAFLMGILAAFSEWILGALAWWNIALGTLLGTALMGSYLLRAHPTLRQALQEELSG